MQDMSEIWDTLIDSVKTPQLHFEPAGVFADKTTSQFWKM